MITIKATRRTNQVLIDVTKLEGTHKRALKRALNEIGSEVVRETARLIKAGPKTGKVYTFKGRPHQASAPGEAPATRSGRLADSGNYKVKNWQEMTVGETAPYAGFLENGTRGRMAPRPHLIKAINNKAQDTVNAILESVKREIRT
jgi:HK97 gp10 family phage protein